MRLVLLLMSLLLAEKANAEDFPFANAYLDGWASGEYHRLDAQLGQQSSLGITLNPINLVSEVRVSYALTSAQDAYSNRFDTPFTLQLTLRGWKLMETNLETADTDYFERERVRDRDIRRQWIMLSVTKSF